MNDDCIGCGYCCHEAPCPVGQKLHGDGAPCPELHFAGGRHWCRWVISCELQEEEGEGELAAKALDIGEGCCSNLNRWRREPIVDRTAGPNTQHAPEGILGMLAERLRQAGFQPVELRPTASPGKENKP